jgi:hypothetical protein
MADAKNGSKKKSERKSGDKHPLLPPVDSSVEAWDLVVQIIPSTIGVHDFKLTFIDPEQNTPVGYGWFDGKLAAQLIGEPLPERTPKFGSQHPDTIMSSGRPLDREDLEARSAKT